MDIVYFHDIVRQIVSIFNARRIACCESGTVNYYCSCTCRAFYTALQIDSSSRWATTFYVRPGEVCKKLFVNGLCGPL